MERSRLVVLGCCGFAPAGVPAFLESLEGDDAAAVSGGVRLATAAGCFVCRGSLSSRARTRDAVGKEFGGEILVADEGLVVDLAPARVSDRAAGVQREP